MIFHILVQFKPIYLTFISSRSLSVNCVLYGKRNFRKFHFPNRRGTQCDKDYLKKHPEEVDRRGVREYGYWEDGKLYAVPEMIPEIIVPDLTGFTLKPYVSYRAQDITQEPFTAEHLFYSVYAEKIKKDFDSKKLNEQGISEEPSENEKLNAENAKRLARSCSSDLFV